jgi:uncharacterized protein involved in type VI secretion and phage assembly
MTTGTGTLSDLLPQPVRGDLIYGVVVGVVTDIDIDADGQREGVYQGLYRVKVKFPWLDGDHGLWARVVTPMAGNRSGLFLPLKVNDEVAVMFEHGDPNHPFVIGALWNGVDRPPAKILSKDQFQYVLQSNSGHTITLDDSTNAEKISIADKSGNQIVIDSKEKTVTITSKNDLTLDAGGNMMIKATGSITILSRENKLALSGGPVNINGDALVVTR